MKPPTLYYEDHAVRIYHGDAREVLSWLKKDSVHAAVFSPPYFAQRQYGSDAREIGIEDDPRAYLAALVDVTTALARVVRDDGSILVNIGDKYQADGPIKNASTGAGYGRARRQPRWPGMSMKSLMMLPARYAIALTDAGMAVRAEIVWHKGSGGSDGQAEDRVRRAHEVIYHVSRGLRHGETIRVYEDPGSSVWRFDVAREDLDHDADFPVSLAARCIRCWAPPGGVVIDPFCGSGTTLVAAKALGRQAIGAIPLL